MNTNKISRSQKINGWSKYWVQPYVPETEAQLSKTQGLHFSKWGYHIWKCSPVRLHYCVLEWICNHSSLFHWLFAKIDLCWRIPAHRILENVFTSIYSMICEDRPLLKDIGEEDILKQILLAHARKKWAFETGMISVTNFPS